MQLALETIEALPISVIDIDRDITLAAANVKAHLPISYADCFVIALAQRLEAIVVTGDPEFRQVESLVEIYWLK